MKKKSVMARGGMKTKMRGGMKTKMRGGMKTKVRKRGGMKTKVKKMGRGKKTSMQGGGDMYLDSVKRMFGGGKT